VVVISQQSNSTDCPSLFHSPLQRPSFEDRFTCPFEASPTRPQTYPYTSRLYFFDMPDSDVSDSDVSDSGSAAAQNPVELEEVFSLHCLWALIDKYVPFLRRSFVRSEEWWRLNWGPPEMHVSVTRRPVLFTKPVLTPMQMFKYLLFWAMQDVLVVFSPAEAVELSKIQKRLKKANDKAAPIWRDVSNGISTRVDECNQILEPVISANRALIHQKSFGPIPAGIEHDLDDIYMKFYRGDRGIQLIGRTDDEAYKVQDQYAREVVRLLQAVDSRFASRAVTCLHKAYGRNSLPLLCNSLVDGLLALCKTDLCKKNLALVSLPSSVRLPPR
jgi:hypothetical protein